MKICLVVPPMKINPRKKGAIPLPPLGLSYINSFLCQNNYDSDIVDIHVKIISDETTFLKYIKLSNQENLLGKFLVSLLPLDNVDVVGFSVIDSSALNNALLMAQIIKEEYDINVVFGGPSIDVDIHKKYDFIDYSIKYNSEVCFVNYLRKIENKTELELDSISFDERPIPDFGSLDMNLYKNIENPYFFNPSNLNPGNILVIPYSWSVNCPYNCSFCTRSYSDEPEKIFYKDTSKIIKEIKELKEKHDTKYFFIMNEYVDIIPEKTIELIDSIKENNLDIRWSVNIRSTIDEELIPKLRESGLTLACLAIDSGSDEELEIMRKGYTIKKAESVLKKCHDSNMINGVNFVFNHPLETDEMFAETFDFLVKNIDYIDILYPNIFRLHYSHIYKNPEKFNIKILSNINKHISSPQFSYEEINGRNWSEIQEKGKQKFDKIMRYFYGYKGEMIRYAFPNMFFFALDKYGNKKDALDYVINYYKKNKENNQPILKITNNNNNFGETLVSSKILSLDIIYDKLSNYSLKGVNSVIISGGEPTLSKDLKKIIKKCFEKKNKSYSKNKCSFIILF
jgi:radical SAM superfamily enzyme YgiQ (UPF0313 family)